MSIGNLRDQGNKGNNFPYQLAALKLAGMSLMKNLTEVSISNASSTSLATDITSYFTANPNMYLVDKSIIFDGTLYVAYLTVASI